VKGRFVKDDMAAVDGVDDFEGVAAASGDDFQDVAEDAVDSAVYGFEPAVADSSERPAEEPDDVEVADEPSKNTARRFRWRAPLGRIAGRRLSAAAVVIGALALLGGTYSTFADSSGATSTGYSAQDITAGQQIYQNSCITCHGANLEGVQGQGPSLIGVGSAAVYFQVSTGRMPAPYQGAYEPAKTPKYDEKQTLQLGAYVESVGGGPQVPSGNLRASNNTLGTGGELFRLNCASCHGVTGKGAPLSAGKYAPSLNSATDRQLYTAMLSGPESMPVFGDNQITPQQKKELINYIQTIKASADPGGAGIDRIGPVSEAVVIWVAGVGAIIIVILWIGAKVR
jgi:ubiquinol-cytochrome c reductase cytochrome c subunit